MKTLLGLFLMDGGRLYCWKGDNWGHCTTPSVYQQISCVFVWYSIPDCHRFTEAERLETLSISIILWRHWANQKMGIDRPWDSSMSLFGCSLFHFHFSSSRRCCSHRSNSSDFLMNTYEKNLNWPILLFRQRWISGRINPPSVSPSHSTDPFL